MLGGAFALLAIATVAWRALQRDRPRDYLANLRLVAAPVVLLLCFMQVLNATFIPLIYFKF